MPKELADLSHACFAFVLIEGRTVLFGIYAHAAEFIDIERASEAADSLLLENGWTAIFAAYGDVTD